MICCLPNFYLYRAFIIFVSLDVSASPHLDMTDSSTPLSIYTHYAVFSLFLVYTLNTQNSPDSALLGPQLRSFTHRFQVLLTCHPHTLMTLHNTHFLLISLYLLSLSPLHLSPSHIRAPPRPHRLITHSILRLNVNVFSLLLPFRPAPRGSFVSLIRLVLL